MTAGRGSAAKLLIEERLRARTMQRQRDAGAIDRPASLPSG
jgi:hypothetical protein